MELIASTVQRVVIGLGVTGLACARFWQRQGVPFVLVDTRASLAHIDSIKAQFPNVSVYLGDVPAAVWGSTPEVVVSPGVALDHPLVEAASMAGAELMGDIDVFMREAKAPVIGVTGSNAKSTVTELVGAMARASGVNVAVGGNLGTAALDLLDDRCELYVLELSSFQLERAGTLGLAVATVLNVSPDHLDRHGDMLRYHQAKHRIFFGSKAAVVNRDDPLSEPLVPPDTKVFSFGLGIPDLNTYGIRESAEGTQLCRGADILMQADELPLAGRHNMVNALAALAIGEAAGLGREAMLNALREFCGLPHRCAVVGEWAGVRYINDSKGTNVGAVKAALDGIAQQRNIILIAGGQGKGADFSLLQEAVSTHCKYLILMGEAQSDMADVLGDSVQTEQVASMNDAVTRAIAVADTGDVVLLSPACASFDMFAGYADRGNQFEQAVREQLGVAV